MKKTILLYLLFLLLANNSHGQVSVLNFDNATEKKMNFSDFQFEFFPLETNISCLLGDPYQVKLFDNKWYICDYATKKICVFNKTGKYLFSISALGNGPNEYLSNSSFTINPYNKNIEIVDGTGNAIVKFNAKGKFVSKHRIPFPFSSFDYLSPNLLVFSKPYQITKKEDNYNLILTDKNYKIVQRYSKMNKKTSSALTFTPHFNLKKYTDKIIWIKAYDKNIYEISDNGLKTKAKINFGNLWPDEEFAFNDKINNFQIIFDTFEKKGWLRYFDIYEMKNDYLATFSAKGNSYLATFNKKTGKSYLYNCEKMPNKFNTIVGYDDDFVIITLNAKDLLKYNFPISKEQKEIIRNIPEDDNPWIITIKKRS